MVTSLPCVLFVPFRFECAFTIFKAMDRNFVGAKHRTAENGHEPLPSYCYTPTSILPASLYRSQAPSNALTSTSASKLAAMPVAL